MRIFLGLLAVSLATPLIAADPVSPDAAKTVASTRPDKMVCESVEELGSRLRGHRVCQMRSQWDDQRRQDKLLIDRSQVQRQLETGK